MADTTKATRGPVLDLGITLLPVLDLDDFPESDGWDHEAIKAAALAIAMARPQGWTPAAHNTGDGVVFFWDPADGASDPTESLEPLLPLDWWPSTGDTFSARGIEHLGFVWV